VFRNQRVRVCETRNRQIERRTEPRYAILQRCFVYPATASAAEAWQCIAYNISAIGIGVTLPVRLPEGTVLTIEAWRLARACSIQARIVRAKMVDLFWFAGCELTKRLSDAELQIWSSGPLDWVDGQKS
jgi:PilZ domain